MPQLDARHGAYARGELGYGSHPRHVVLAPEAETPVGDPALRDHGGCFHEQATETADREASEMVPVPGVHVTVRSTVLTHR